MTRIAFRLVLFLAVVLSTGCKTVRDSLSWQSQPFVRVPAPLPAGYDDITNNTVYANGWMFRHVVACPVRTNLIPEAHWWIARPVDHRELGLGHASVWRLLTRGSAIPHGSWRRIQMLAPEISDASFAAFGAYPQMVQPDLVFTAKAARKAADETAAHRRNSVAQVAESTDELEVLALPEGGVGKRAE